MCTLILIQIKYWLCSILLSLLFQIQSENSLDDQVRPEDSLYWLPAPVCMWSGFPTLHSSFSWISQDLWWNRRPKLGPKTTSPRSETAKKPVSQQHPDWTKGRIWTEVNPDKRMYNLAEQIFFFFTHSLCFFLYWSFLLISSQLLELCHCVQESQDHQLAQQVVTTRPTLELRNIRLLPNDIDALAFVVNSVGDNGIGLDFGACSMESECLDVLPRCQYIHYLW